jgi:hypothetical protein
MHEVHQSMAVISLITPTLQHRGHWLIQHYDDIPTWCIVAAVIEPCTVLTLLLPEITEHYSTSYEYGAETAVCRSVQLLRVFPAVSCFEFFGGQWFNFRRSVVREGFEFW